MKNIKMEWPFSGTVFVPILCGLKYSTCAYMSVSCDRKVVKPRFSGWSLLRLRSLDL
jgi:hypothetical protein